jgi:hypothetical protein
MYIKTTANNMIDKYPYSIPQLRKDNPSTSFPKRPSEALLASYEVYPVTVQQVTPGAYQTVESAAEPTLIDGVWTLEKWAVDLPPDEKNALLQKDCERAVEEYIQAEVDAYNSANNTLFRDVHSCVNYASVDGYTHQTFCANVWAWSVNVWEAARQMLADAQAGTITITSPQDVIDGLPVFSS